MSLRDLLPLTTVTVQRDTVTPDGMGGNTTTSVITTVPNAIIWGAGSGSGLLSDKITAESTHVLAIVTGDYIFNDNDRIVTYNSNTYRLVGHPDDIMQKGELTIHGMEQKT